MYGALQGRLHWNSKDLLLLYSRHSNAGRLANLCQYDHPDIDSHDDLHHDLDDDTGARELLPA
jgi:hypothetical protein